MKGRLALGAVCAAVSLVLAGCSDDGDEPLEGAATEAEDLGGEAEEAASEAGDAAEEAAGEAGDAAEEGASEAGDAAEQAAGEVGDVVTELRARGLDTLAGALEAIGVQNLIEDSSFTLFAPNDEALLSLGPERLAELASDPQSAADILQSHVVDEPLTSEELAAMDQVETSSGVSVPISSDGTGITVGGATVTEADIEAGGGVIHIIDGVIDVASGDGTSGS